MGGGENFYVEKRNGLSSFMSRGTLEGLGVWLFGFVCMHFIYELDWIFGSLSIRRRWVEWEDDCAIWIVEKT